MKSVALLSLAAISALASEPLTIQKIMVEADTPQQEVSQVIPAATPAAKTMSGDSAALLSDIPGVSLYSNGGFASLPAIHGMADDRVKIDIDGMQITSACPNHMNPALSYIDTSKVAVMEVIAGITPVSEGGDSIGGSVIVKSKEPVFAKNRGEVVVDADVTGFYRSNSAARGASLNASAANDKISVSYAGFAEKAANYKNGKGEIVKATLHQMQNNTATLAYKLDEGVVSLKLGKQNVDFEGFANQYMDMLGNESTYGNLSYKGRIGKLLLDANIFRQNTDHYMNKISTERSGNMPMYTEAQESGVNIKATLPYSSTQTFKFGADYDRYRLNDWWPPVTATVGGMGPNTFWNLNDGQRDRLGIFAESVSQWSEKLSSTIGIRTDRVSMNTGNVTGYNTVTPPNMMSNDPVDANAFNALDHKKQDNNYDFTAMTKYEYSASNDFELGFARKTRSPNLYERYSWAGGYGGNLNVAPIRMDMAMINWFGDANGYVGNLNLKPEVANTISATASWHDGASSSWGVKITPYYTKVQNYIDVKKIGSVAGDGTKFTNIQLLQFENHDAHLFGADLSGFATLWDNSENGVGTLKSVIGYTRGFRDDGGSLYHMMPFHAKVSLNRISGAWSNGIDAQAVMAKDSVDAIRSEPKTAGYALVDLRTGYQISKNIKFDVAVTNLFNRAYALPLGGVDVVNYSPSTYTPMQGMGRSFNTALNVKF